jgi:hypothetical protein
MRNLLPLRDPGEMIDLEMWIMMVRIEIQRAQLFVACQRHPPFRLRRGFLMPSRLKFLKAVKTDSKKWDQA